MKKILHHTWSLLTPSERRHYSRLIVMDILISIVDIISLAMLLWIIQFYLQPGKNNLDFLPFAAERGSTWFIAMFFILFSTKNAAGFLVAKAHFKFISKVALRISRNNLVSYQEGSYTDFVQTDSSVHTRKISYQPFEFCQYILTGVQQLTTQVCLISITIIAILLFNAQLFLILLAILLPPVVLVFYLIKKRLDKSRKIIQASNERSFQYLFDVLKGFVESNIYNRNEFFRERFMKARQKFSNALFDSFAIQHMPARIIEIFAILGLFILIAVASWSGANDAGSLLTIGAFMAAAYKIIPGIVKIINVSGQMRSYAFALVDIAPVNKEKKQEPNHSANSLTSVELKKVNFAYNGKPVLNNISLKLNSGDFAGITGDSGKGKTTLLNIMLGFLHPQIGEMFINGQPAANGTIRTWWPSIAYTRQQGFLIHDNLLRNITLEETNIDQDRLQMALDISGLDTLVNQSPEGLDKMIMENGKNISGGQQQRIAIARAIYKNADLLLLDEPFNELDENSENKILQHLKTLTSQGKMVVLVTHNKEALRCCTKIVSLDESN